MENPGLANATSTMQQLQQHCCSSLELQSTLCRGIRKEKPSPQPSIKTLSWKRDGNLTKIKAFRTRVAEYNMQAPFLIRELVNPAGAEPWDRFGSDDTRLDLMKHWSSFTMEHICLFQKDTNNTAGNDEDLTSATWLKELMVNSSETSLTQKVDENFEKLGVMEQGGITYMKISLDEMFYVTQDAATVLQDWLKTTAQDGLTKIPGENVAVHTAQIDAVYERLAENKKLSGETPVLVLTAFTKCSVKQFTGPFELILNSECVKNMGTPASLDDDNKKTLTHVREILLKANNEFHSLNTTKKCNVPESRINACYNCDGDHLIPDCNEPCDEAKIVRKKKAAR